MPSSITEKHVINAGGPPLPPSPSDVSSDAAAHKNVASITEQELFDREAAQAEHDLRLHEEQALATAQLQQQQHEAAALAV